QSRNRGVEGRLGFFEELFGGCQLSLGLVLRQACAEPRLLGAKERSLLTRVELVDHGYQLTQLLLPDEVGRDFKGVKPDHGLRAPELDRRSLRRPETAREPRGTRRDCCTREARPN